MKIFASQFILIAVLGINTSMNIDNEIVYLTPESVNAKICDYITKDKQIGQYHYYGIWHTQNDTTSILISRSTSFVNNKLIKKTNRFINLPKYGKLPIVLNSDLLFSTDFHYSGNEKGKKTLGNILISPSGYLIVFTGSYNKERIINDG